jgi:hypothetical protein
MSITIENRLPSLDEVRAAIQPPLTESYWWFEGWNFNRPVIAEVGVGVKHSKIDLKNENGPYVWCRFFEEGFDRYMDAGESAELVKMGTKLKFTGPILYS